MQSESGIVLVDKEEDISSAKLIAKIKRHFKIKKIGHSGTLDPFASGLLVCIVGKATKLSKFFLKSDKRYLAKLHLGIRTDTFDREGKILEKKEIKKKIAKEEISEVLFSFKGKQKQLPPFFSALKHKGVPLYKLARQNIFYQKPARDIEIKEIKFISYNPPFVEFEVLCTAGTYIRTLADDIGKKLNCGAYLQNLRRVASGNFDVKNAKEFSFLAEKKLEDVLISMSKAVDMPEIEVDEEIIQKIKFGQVLSLNIEDNIYYKLIDKKDNLLAIIKKKDSSIKYEIVFISS